MLKVRRIRMTGFLCFVTGLVLGIALGSVAALLIIGAHGGNRDGREG